MSVAIITGSAGLIGSEAVKFFDNLGMQVVGIDNDMRKFFFGEEASTKWNRERLEKQVKNYQHYDVDIRDYLKIKEIFQHFGADISLIIHTAAQPSHDWAASDPFSDFTVNANGTLNLLEATRHYCPEAVFIFTSTNKVYGDLPNFLPLVELEKRWEIDSNHKYAAGIAENMSIDQSKHSLFGASKVAADVLVQEYGRYFDMKTASFRGGCLTGPNHSGTQLHGFLAYLMKCGVTGKPYTIFGYKGKQVRDNIHSSDLIAAFHEFYQEPGIAEVYNIDIQTDRFTASVQEPNAYDGWHVEESFSYLVLEKGTWQLDDNTLLEVGTVNTDLLGNEGWENISFANNFSDDPLVFSQVQTNNDSDFVLTRQKNTSNAGFQLTMQEEEALMNSSHEQETLGWLAISAGSGNWTQNKFLAGTTGNNITDNWNTIDFKNNFSQYPVFIASIATYNGSDTSGLRSNILNSNQVNIKIEEETSRDEETRHTREVVNFLAIEENSFLRGLSTEAAVYNSCQKDLISTGVYHSTLWTTNQFDGNFCRQITGDAKHFEVNIEANSGGLATGVTRQNSIIRVDDMDSQARVSSTIDVALEDTRKWWVGPKMIIRNEYKYQGLDGNYENYVVENSSISPQQFHERLTKLNGQYWETTGTYLGQTIQDGSMYRHYYIKYATWSQFWAIRQDYRNTGSVSLKPILNLWRNNGLPNAYIDDAKVIVEVSGEAHGNVEMSEIDITNW